MDGIIFDVDGTLWDATELIAASWTDSVHRTKLSDMVITSKHLKDHFGQTLPDIAAALFPDFSKEDQMYLIGGCCESEHHAIVNARPPFPLYPDLEQTLDGLSKKYPLFIVSNCQAGYIEDFLSVTGFGHYFQDHLCPGDTGEAKAANICTIAKRHHLQVPVYVGDTFGDFQACEKAGVPMIYASYGFGEVPHPYASIRTPLDLLDIL